MTIFETLNSVNVNEHTEKKGNLTYLSWAWAWAEIKKRYPAATYTIYETPEGVNYFTDGRTAWVKTGLAIEGLEHIEYLPIMDSRNKSIPLENITSFDVNKAIQRSLTKAAARHGLGLYIYAGEDLPEEDATEAARAKTLTETEWRALRKKIMSIPETPPATQEEADKVVETVLARYGHSPDDWKSITVGVERAITKDEQAIKDELAKNKWKEDL